MWLGRHILTSAAVALFAAPRLIAQTPVDTMTGGFDTFLPFNSSSSTIGQTFTVPSGDTRLTRFAFVLGHASPGFVFRAELYAWSGTNATGPALYESAPRHVAQDVVYEEVAFDIPFGAKLTAGSQYVFFLTASKDYAPIPFRQVSLGFKNAYFYPGALGVGLTDGGDPSKWTTQSWQVHGGVFAFRAAFSSPVTVSGDFDGDGQPDIVIRNYTTGHNAIWLMNGTRYRMTVDLPSLTDTNWRLEGVGDFNGDAKPDLVWRNYATGQNAIWLMDGTSLLSIVDLPAISNLNFRIEAVGDLNNDGLPDVLLRNAITGQNSVWLMSGTNLVMVVDLPGIANPAVQMVGTGDFDGDGKTDIVFRNYGNGANAVWRMNGTTLLGVTDLPALPDTNFRLQAIADYTLYGGGTLDLVFRNQVTGANAIWAMNQTSCQGVVDLPALPSSSFEIAGPR